MGIKSLGRMINLPRSRSKIMLKLVIQNYLSKILCYKIITLNFKKSF